MIGDRGGAPAVSIIVIFHNEERFIEQALASVLAQTHADWELLLVDDGSTDASATVAARWVDHRPERIRYLTHPGRQNRGMSASRNLGIAAASGTWVSFLDADDVWLPDKLERQLALLTAHPGLEVLVSPAQWWRSWADSEAEDWEQALSPPDRGPAVVNPPKLVERFLDDEWRSICDLVIARAAIERVGCYEPAFTGMFEDQVFHTKVLAELPALVTKERWYRYRQHDTACTAAAHRSGDHELARVRFLRWLDHYIDQRGQSARPELDGLRRRVRRELLRRRFPTALRLIRLGRRLATAAVQPAADLVSRRPTSSGQYGS